MLNIPVIANSVNPFTVQARAVDQAGNLSPLSPSFNLTIDTPDPDDAHPGAVAPG